MKQYGFFESRVKSFLITVLLFGMLLLSRNTLISTSLLGFYRSQFLMILLIFLTAALFLILNRNDLKCIFTDKRIIIAVGICGIVMLPMIVKRDWQMMYLSILMCLMFAVFLTFFVSYKDVAKVYVVSIAVLSAYSVVATYGLRLLPDSGLLSVPVFTNTNNVEFYNFGLAFVSQSYVKNRNFGIFREPGVYQYFLLLALFLNNFTISWQKTSKCWLINGILTVTMLTTMATGGFVELGILAVILFFHKKLYRSRTACLIVAAGFIIGLIGVGMIIRQRGQLYWELYGMFVSKFLPGEESGIDRVNSILTNAMYFIRNPLAGETVSEVLYSVQNNTSSTTILFAILGLFGGSLNIAAWFALVWKREQGIMTNLGLLLVLFMSFNTQNLVADVFFWLIPTMALIERGIPLLERLKQRSVEHGA